MRVTCEKCVYWESPKADTEKRLGECRRNPPVHEFWPVTLPDDWCGQAMPKDTRASKYYQEEDEDSLKKELVETMARLNDRRVHVEKEMEAKLLDRATHWLVPLLYEAAARVRTDADDLKAAHAPDGDWTGEELAKVNHDRDIRLSARLIQATARLERGEI